LQFEKFYYQWDRSEDNNLEFVKGKTKLFINYK